MVVEGWVGLGRATGQRRLVGDSRVLALVKAFLKAGILTEDVGLEDSTAGTPQGGILSPLLANVASSVLSAPVRIRASGVRE